ncbi:maleylpyruvate isomerase family mycothiol-dependent enzyme [Nocardioides seonyuensis]|uniref:Maleylpyruvate isomerase family mycothiol-dependent enzyme n=1 Tax=Nocardioides seonyuensis TaxID=2518371 RepID=A0A4P7IIF4_9ACTN|nr:maleylpyruvate isomerase family mycothiol-dependent enzyme [Nocardioides seonyuensis]QBX55661.1 maleylpyruvate isomerase family mycothiol-dependent enzyme [Nocardioides seonyuensis]
MTESASPPESRSPEPGTDQSAANADLAGVPELRQCVDAWWEAIDSFIKLMETVPPEQWATPTDLPGWDVHAVVAHIAHLESLLAGEAHDEVDVSDAPHVRGVMGTFTEQGVVARRDRSADELINEIHESTTKRHTSLVADPPTDPDAPAPGLFGAIGWSTRTLLRNRPLDVWMHEQDVRRAVGIPGGLDSSAAVHTASYLLESLPIVVAKRAKAPAGATVVVEVEGHGSTAVRVGEDGRGSAVAVPDEPTTRLRTDREAFILLAGGRRAVEQGRVEVDGDTELAERVLAAMAVTP